MYVLAISHSEEFCGEYPSAPILITEFNTESVITNNDYKENASCIILLETQLPTPLTIQLTQVSTECQEMYDIISFNNLQPYHQSYYCQQAKDSTANITYFLYRGGGNPEIIIVPKGEAQFNLSATGNISNFAIFMESF